MPRRRPEIEQNKIKLLKFPSLVTEMIIKEMSFVDVLQFSLSSARCKRMASSARNRTPGKMRIEITSSRCHIAIFELVEDTFKKFLFSWTFFTRPFRKTEQLKIGGIDMENRRVRGDGWLKHESFTPKNAVDLALNAAISHLLSVFRCIEVADIDINFEMLNDQCCVRKALESVKSTSRLRIRGDKFNSDVRFILSNIEVTRSFESPSRFSMGTTIDDRLNCSELINIENSSWMSRETLWNMNCEQVHLLRSRFNSDDVMEFLRRWMDGNGKDKISYVYFEHPLGFGPLDFEELNATPWDPVIEDYDATRKLNTL
ncbi:unnamed protein product [Caenorhabditis nigoni]